MSFLVRLPSTCLDAKMEIVLNTDYRWGGERYNVPHPNHGKFKKRRAAYSSKYGNVAHQLSGNQGDGTSQTRQQPTPQVSALRHSERIRANTAGHLHVLSAGSTSSGGGNQPRGRDLPGPNWYSLRICCTWASFSAGKSLRIDDQSACGQNQGCKLCKKEIEITSWKVHACGFYSLFVKCHKTNERGFASKWWFETSE